MKKILLFLLIATFFSACSSEEDDVGDGLVNYSDNEAFEIRIPKKWKLLQDKDAVLPKPNTGNIELAVSSTAQIEDFANSLVILSEEIETENINASDYISSVNLAIKEDIKTYSGKNEFLIRFGKGDDAPTSKVYTYDAKYNDKTPLLKIVQTAMICKNKAYLMTIAIPSSTKDTLRYQYLLSTFRCK